MYRIAICEDETAISAHLRRLCEIILSDNHIEYTLSVFSSAEKFEYALSLGRQFDLLILDIELEGKSGMDLARELRRKDNLISIIFISAYDGYLRDGYSVQPIHFLIKPVNRQDLEAAIQADLRLNHRNVPHIRIRSGSRTLTVAAGDILYVEVMDHILYIHTRDDKIPSRTTLTLFMNDLPTELFSRCHNSFAVNLRYVNNISRSAVSLENGITLPIGRKYYDDFQKAFIRYMNQM